MFKPDPADEGPVPFWGPERAVVRVHITHPRLGGRPGGPDLTDWPGLRLGSSPGLGGRVSSPHATPIRPPRAALEAVSNRNSSEGAVIDPLWTPSNRPQTQCSSQIRPRKGGKSFLGARTSCDAYGVSRRASAQAGSAGSSRPSAGPVLTTVASVPSWPAIPVYKPISPRRHGSPCPIRAPPEAASPVFKPDRAPIPASPFGHGRHG